MADLALKRLESAKPFIAAQGAMMCVVKGCADDEEKAAIVRLSNAEDTDFRIAGRTLHDWVLAAMDVLDIRKCEESEDSDVWGLIDMMKDPDWKEDMKQIFA